QVCCENGARTLRIELNAGIWPLWPRRIAHATLSAVPFPGGDVCSEVHRALPIGDDVSWTAGGFFSPSDSPRKSWTARWAWRTACCRIPRLWRLVSRRRTPARSFTPRKFSPQARQRLRTFIIATLIGVWWHDWESPGFLAPSSAHGFCR